MYTAARVFPAIVLSMLSTLSEANTSYVCKKDWKPRVSAILSVWAWQRSTRCRKISKRCRKAMGGPRRRNDASGGLRRTMSRKEVALESMT